MSEDNTSLVAPTLRERIACPRFRNQLLADHCEAVLADYNAGNDGIEDSLIDLLTDAMHWCRRDGVSFERHVRAARGHFRREVREETG